MVRHAKERATKVAKEVLEAAKKLTLRQCVTAIICVAVLGTGIATPVWAFSGNKKNDTVETVESTTTSTTVSTTMASSTTSTSTEASKEMLHTTATSTATTLAVTTTGKTTETVDVSNKRVSVVTSVRRSKNASVAPKKSAKQTIASTEASYANTESSTHITKDTESSTTTTTTVSLGEETELTTGQVVEEDTKTSSNDWLYGIEEDDSDFILLCNAVAHEAGSYEVSVENKAKVAEVICNRKDSSVYPDTIYDVLTQRGQFSGASSYVNLGDYSSKVSEDVKEAVRGYLSGEYTNHGYIGFWGDGHQNHFS